MARSDTVPASLVLDSSSFIDENAPADNTTTHGGIIEFKVPGKFIHFNTIEEYNAFDLKALEADKEMQARYKLPDLETAFHDNYFIMACFGDLKNYDFHYKIGTLQGTEKMQALKGKKLSK